MEDGQIVEVSYEDGEDPKIVGNNIESVNETVIDINVDQLTEDTNSSKTTKENNPETSLIIKDGHRSL